MANPTLNWRYVGTLTFVSSISNAMDAVYALGTASTYTDGSARVPGTNSAWTWNREVAAGPVTVAAYGVPPVNALSFNFIIGGTVGASAYTFLAADSAALANCIVYGMNRSSGAYTTWTSATPFTNAGFSGFWRGTRTFAVIAYDTVAMWESQEGCLIQFGNAAAGSTSSIGFGALFDPLSSAPLNAEVDGRLYTMWGGGSNGATGSTVMLGGTAASGSNTYRFGTFVPTSSFTSPNGDITRVPLYAWNFVGTFFGQSRQWYLTKDSTTRQTWTNGATVIGYIWAASTLTSGDALVLTY